MPSKPWYLSRTILGAIVQFVLTVVLLCTHHDLRGQSDRIVNALQELLTGIVAVAGVAGTIFGRFHAARPVHFIAPAQPISPPAATPTTGTRPQDLADK